MRLCDALVGMADISEGSIDLIVTDPPYRVISGGNTTKHRRCSGMLSANDGRIFEHNDIAPKDYAADLFRVLSDPGHLWIFVNELNRRAMEDALLTAGFKIHMLGGWIKNNVTPNRWGMKNVEYVFLARKGAARTLYTPGLKQFEACPNIIGSKRHPTEKPVDLLRLYIAASSQPGQTVLDPFMGSGSTGVAAMQMGRRFVGFEIDPEYYNVACQRMGVMP